MSEPTFVAIQITGPDNTSMDDAFWTRVDRTGGPDACWPWMGYRYPTGYGRSSQVGHRSEYAHRKALTLAIGRPLRAGEFACHHCDNPPCCNPAHLFAGTAKDNSQDRDRKGRDARSQGYRPVRRAELRSHCVHGHPYTPENTIRWADGSRRCRDCARIRHRAYRERRRAA